MKLPKCPKTVSGKHSFVTKYFYISGIYAPSCDYCGLVDDRKTKNDKELND